MKTTLTPSLFARAVGDQRSTRKQRAMLLALSALFCIPTIALRAQAVRDDSTTTTTTTTRTTAVPTTAEVTTTTTTSATTLASNDDVVYMTPFEVQARADEGYAGATTLSGNRLNTDVRDIGNAVQVVTPRFLKDIGATSNTSLLQYTTNTEVGGVYGNFAGVGDGPQLNESLLRPNVNTRIRGLANADNTRDLFITEIPWDSYNTDRIDLNRGPNSIIFGQGSPAGIINAVSAGAMFRDANKVEVRFGSFGSLRGVLDINKVILPDQISIRLNGLGDTEKYKQDPAFNTDKRLGGSIRVEPKFLKIGGARTVLKASFETGNVNSNNPRELPPGDLITPWFSNAKYIGADGSGNDIIYNGVNKGTYNPFQLWDHLSGRPNHGQERPNLLDTSTNPYYQPYIDYMAGIQDNPVAFFGGNGAPTMWVTEATDLPGGRAPDGSIDGNIGAYPFNRIGGIATTSKWANNAHLPFSQFGLYKNNVLTDSSIFDFYNKLIDGDSKREWQTFNQVNVSLAQTFFHDMFGIDGSYHHENFKAGQSSLFDGNANALGIDIMSTFADGTPTGLNGEPYADGTPNPNVGRPYIASNGQNGNNQWQSEREAARLTAFVNYDFMKNSKAWWARILGEETLTGLLANDKQNTDSRTWQRYAILDPSYRNLIGQPNLAFNDVRLAPSTVMYLGSSLADRSSASGANIPNAQSTPSISSGMVRMFNSTWNSTVSPGAYWANDFYLPGTPGYDSTQSENPANYVGWMNVPVAITDANASQANRDTLTTNAALAKTEYTSQALVWQGKLLDKSVVVTYGWRKDIVKSWATSRNVASSVSPTNTLGLLDLGPSYALPGDPNNRIEVQSHAYSIMAHLSDLPFISQFAKKLPVDISFYYNNSTNFQPFGSRVDVYGEAIAPPSGKTTDRGILLETRDRKYSLKVNYFVNSLKNSTSSNLTQTWFIGDSQAWGANFANVFQYNLGGWDMSTANQGDPQRYNYGPAPGETTAQAAAREQAAIDGWHAWQASVDPRFYKAWSINTANFQNPQGQVLSAVPQNFALTEDSVSKGWEVELNAEPLHNLRITLNVSKTDAQRNNIGGTNMTNFINAYENALNNTAAGDLRQWWGTADVPNAKDYWYGLIGIGGEWALKKLQEMTKAPELREWRVNVVANYDVDRGFLKGVNVGGAMRYQSSVVIGYPPLTDSTFSSINFDINNPYEGPSETNFDFWIGYTTKLTKGITWHIQLNIANVFKKDSLIPITTQPDGTPAGYRIAPSQTFFVTNTFEF